MIYQTIEKLLNYYSVKNIARRQRESLQEIKDYTDSFDDSFFYEISWIQLKTYYRNSTSHRAIELNHRNNILLVKTRYFREVIINVGRHIFIILSIVYLLSNDSSAKDVFIGSINPDNELYLFMTVILFGIVIVISLGIFQYFFRVLRDFKNIEFLGNQKEVNIVGFFGKQTKFFFEDIHAVQVLSKYASRRERYAKVYEVNIVKSNQQRLNIFNHSNKELAFRQANRLGRHIGVPVWDNLFYKKNIFKFCYLQ